MSIDEQRINFTPTLWDRDPERIVQVLFPGGHADVGGGYLTTESGLSDCALQWMTRELRGLGVRIGPPVIPEQPNPRGVGHEEWTKPMWKLMGNRLREIPNAPDLALSEAVLLRLGAEAGLLSSPYNPANIASYVITKMAAEGVEVIDLNDPGP